MFEQFRPWVTGDVAELGPGVGTFTERLLDAGTGRLLLLEPDEELASRLERRFGSDPRVTLVREGLPGSPALAAERGRLGFVLCQNVLEHVEDDATGVAAMAAALRPGGRLGLLVPAHPRLYGSLDRTYGHHRRYTKERVRRLMDGAELELDELYSFNLLGVAGWWVKSRRGATSLGSRSLAAYEGMLPAWRAVERRVRPPAGLSLVAVARRPGRT
jgi:SAM-dependent methyltransferase